jgi:hypothetical protein
MWLDDHRLGDEWKPTRCKFVIAPDWILNKVEIYSDPGAAFAWRRGPYLSTIRQIASAGLRRSGMVFAIDNGRSTIILPDRDVDLGILVEDDRVLLSEVRTPTGLRYEPSIVKAADVEGLPIGQSFVR